MPAFIDLSGKRFGRLIVISRSDDYISPKGFKRTVWNCQCDCGNTRAVESTQLTSGHTKSCGCLRKELVSKSKTTHGKKNTKIYHVWQSMKCRCGNKNNKSYKDYGARGIKVCDEWLEENGFLNFYYWATNNGYSESLTIDRINVNGNYEPSNCRWVSRLVQSNNKRNNVLITHNGETHNISQWEKMLNIKRGALRSRVSTYGMSPDEAISRSINYKKKVEEN